MTTKIKDSTNSTIDQNNWERPSLGEPNAVEMGGAWGDALSRGEKRIGLAPYTAQFVLADLNFGMERWFTNFSGDISGRYLELISLCSSHATPLLPTLVEVMDKIPALQKPDGHFGADIDWTQPIDFGLQDIKAKMMPAMWGNGRILLGLLAAHERFGDKRLLDSARKLGDFYVNIAADRFCDPKRTEEYKESSGYAIAYVTCVFHGVAGLIQLGWATDDARYLKTAQRMADFHEGYDALPVGHSHGSISTHEALLMLYEDTGETKYLKRVTDRWAKVVADGYVNPSGSVLEKFVVTGFNRDEGCSESDWLRLNLRLWSNTGATRYLDMAERLLWTGYLANQWPDGGFGHRLMSADPQGVYAFGCLETEAIWCCNFHGPLGLRDLKHYLAVGGSSVIYYNFPVDFKAPVEVGQEAWVVDSKTITPGDGVPVRCEVNLSGPKSGRVALMVRIPDWADEVIIKSANKQIAADKADGYLRTQPITPGQKLEIDYYAQVHLESRRFERIAIPSKLPAKLDEIVVRQGPGILLNANSGKIEDVALCVGVNGAIKMPPDISPKLAPWVKLEVPNAEHAMVFNVKLAAQ